MNTIVNAFYTKPLALYLIAALLAISTFAGPAEAMFVPAAQQNHEGSARTTDGRAADLAKIQSALESKIVRQHLKDYGLAPEEAMVRANSLSDEQIHQLASHTDALQAGGDGGLLFGLMIICMLAVLLVFLVQGRIVIK